MYTMTMTRSYLWVLLMLQLWPRPLAAAQSLRGTSDADAEAKAELGGPAAVDAELDHRAEQVEEIDDARGRRTISQDMMSLGASNSIDTITIDQFHRDERGEGHSRLFPSPFQTRVIGGRDASEDVTSTVSLQDSDGNHFCGGSLVSKDCVLTAAHCTDAVTGKGQITAVIGRHRLGDDKEGERIQVRNTYMHPRYDVKQAHVKWEYDFALMCLMRPTKAHVEVVQLNKDPYLPRGGSLVAVVGWGDMDRDEYISRPAETLQMANLRIVSNKACDQITGRYGEYSVSYHGFIHDDMMCAKNRKRDSCQGDSGGPLMYRGIQIGITSWGVGCNNRNFPGVYARVSSAYDWVQRNICIRSAIPDKQFDCERWRRNLGEAEENF